jgi:hypothetical protein
MSFVRPAMRKVVILCHNKAEKAIDELAFFRKRHLLILDAAAWKR